MQLDIVSPDKSVFSGEVSYVGLPGTGGRFGVLDDHAALISSLKAGIVDIKDADGKEQEFEINGGVVEVLKNKVIVLAE